MRKVPKVPTCGDTALSDLASDEVQQNMNLLPRVDIADISDYLVYDTNVLTKEQLKAKKGLKVHNVTSGWVQQPFTTVFAYGCVVIGKARTI